MTQNEQIYNHMKLYGGITTMEAITNYGCTRLAARIAELKAAGVEITSEKPKGKKYSVYRLAK